MPHDLDQITRQLTMLARARTAQGAATVLEVEPLPGHAGFSYSFVLERPADHGKSAAREKLVLRLAPPGVRPTGTADVARQGRVMASLEGTGVPVPPVLWVGDETQWFGRPYFVVAFLDGDKLAPGESKFRPVEVPSLARRAIAAMAALHAVDWKSRVGVWGPPVSLEKELVRLDNLLDRPTLDPDFIARAPALRDKLRATMHADPRIGCVHGDLQWSNCLFADGCLRGVIDWELSLTGAVLIDVGWICLFSDEAAWDESPLLPKYLPTPEEMIAFYGEQAGATVSASDARWYRAFAAYRFGVITAFNLMLHRRGKRIDPLWEEMAISGRRLFARGLELIG